MDITEFKAIIESHQQKMNEQINTQERFLDRFERLMNYPEAKPSRYQAEKIFLD